MNLNKIKNKEVRTAGIETSDGLVLEGIPIVFDTPTTIKDQLGTYTEIIKRSALDGVDLSDVKLLYNHDVNKIPLARSPKTMTLGVDNKGLSMRAELPATEEGKAIHTATKRGDLSGMSFSFTVAPGGDNFDTKTNTRTISKIDKVLEVSVTPFPAYEQTSLSARSRTIETADINDLKVKINKILFKGDN